MLGASRRALVAAFIVASAAGVSGGCSFLFDFPQEGSLGGGGSGVGTGGGDATVTNGPGGGGVGGDGGGGGPAVGPAVYWEGVPSPFSDSEVVTVTSLAHVAETDILYAYGSSTNGLDGLSLPTGTTDQIFLLGFPSMGSPAVMMNGISCDRILGWPITRRIGQWENEDEFFFAGSLPGDAFAPQNRWGYGLGNSDGCVAGPQISLPQTSLYSHIPSGGGVTNSQISANVIAGTEGMFFEWDYRSPVVAGIGLLSGDPDTVPNDGTSYVIYMQEDVLDLADIAVFDTIPNELSAPDAPLESWVGGIEVDGLGQAWFTGSACGIGPCTDPQVFLGRWNLQDPSPTLMVQNPGVPSGGTSVEFVDGLILVGGRYEGELNFLSEIYPMAQSTVPFVAAVESSNGALVWSWPSDADAAGFDPTRWKSVADMAIVGDRETGSLWVAGCSVPQGSTSPDCTTVERGKSGFVTRIALATGLPEWTGEVELVDPAMDAFVPMAIAASDAHVWVAATFRGPVNAFGTPIDAPDSFESVILDFAP